MANLMFIIAWVVGVNLGWLIAVTAAEITSQVILCKKIDDFDTKLGYKIWSFGILFSLLCVITNLMGIVPVFGDIIADIIVGPALSIIGMGVMYKYACDNDFSMAIGFLIITFVVIAVLSGIVSCANGGCDDCGSGSDSGDCSGDCGDCSSCGGGIVGILIFLGIIGGIFGDKD